MSRDPVLSRLLRRMRRHRRFPDNTCPASRHAQLIAETLAEEPDHVAGSIASVVGDLYAARTMLDRLGYTWTIRADGATVWVRKPKNNEEAD